MMRLSSFAVAFAACLTLAAAPVLAQPAAPAGGGMQDNMKGMKGMKMAKPAKRHVKTAMMKHTCMDYAWGSQDEKDCEAGTKKPPMMMHHSKKSM